MARPGGSGGAGTGGDAEVEACTVLHVDLDAFFAAVEVLDDPSLAGLPVIVGGSSRRGVVASCTYEARAYGIHSAMPSVEARRRCPHAVFLSGRFGRYAEKSEELHGVLGRFSPVVEGIGLDEAFVDVSGVRRLLGSPPTVARAIREAVRDELQLDCAVGVARTKLVAKLASRAAKPVPSAGGPRPGPGVVTVLPSEELAFLQPMSIRALWGVGPATARRLQDLGVATVGDLAGIPPDTLVRTLGEANGRLLGALARGEDPRRVEADRETKSVGHEETFAADLHAHDALHPHLVRMADAVGQRLRQAGLRGRTVIVKVRFGDRRTITRAHSLPTPSDSARAVAAVASALLDGVEVGEGVRLLGVSVSGLGLAGTQAQQLSFDDGGSERPEDDALDGDRPLPDPRAPAWHEVEAAVSAIRARYGHGSVGPAALMERAGLHVKRQGDTQWGPDEPDRGPTARR